MALPTTKSEKEKNHLKKKYLWYGKPKSGKTTTAANLGDDNNKSLFFCAEPGHSFVEIYKWENADGEQPQTWNDFISCCKELYTQEHDYSLLVIDTVDILWNWCTKHVCNQLEISHPSEIGFGKGYQAVSDEFSRVCNKLGQKGIGFIFITHEKEYEAQIGPHKQTCITTTLSAGAKKFIHGFVDYIWYFTSTPENTRYILTDYHDNINAGSRGDIEDEPLPLKMAMDPKIIMKFLNESKPRVTPLFSFSEEETIDI